MENTKFKRITAYLIDILIVTLLITLLSNIKFLNPYENEYKKAYQDYTEYTESIANTTNPKEVFTEEYFGIFYDINHYSICLIIIEAVVILLYFTLFPTFNNNQTIGKKLLKLTVTKENKKDKTTILTHLVRSLFIPLCINSFLLTSNIFNILSILLLLTLKGKIYLIVTAVLTLIICIYCYIDVFMMLLSKDNKSLHDRITKTKVVEAC